MRKQDEFIKEKLAVFTAPPEEEIEPPADLQQKCERLFDTVTAQPVAARKRTWKMPVFASFAAACLICVITICCIFCSGGDSVHQNRIIENKVITYGELVEKYDFLLPKDIISTEKIFIKADKKTKVIFSAEMKFSYVHGNCEIDICKNGFDFESDILFTSLTEKNESDYVTYLYGDYPNKALAKYEYNGYCYFLTYESKTPEKLHEMIRAFEIC
ncbi:MAG: hypothetical protein HFE47_06240 [Clostridia bacterium]|nr:hypothetical protein [Clostridia bacterium]